MRWEALFADLEAQWDAEEEAAWRADVAARERSERASVAWSDRAAASVGDPVRVRVSDSTVVVGRVVDVADQWILLAEDDGSEVVVVSAAIDAIEGLHHATARSGEVQRRLTLGHVLRRVARDRARVTVVTRSVSVIGTIASVGADHVDVTDRGQPASTVPMAAIVLLRRAGRG